MVAVQNAHRVSVCPVFAEDFDRGNPDRAGHFQGFGAGNEFLAVRGAKEIDLDLDSDSDAALPAGRMVIAAPAA